MSNTRTADLGDHGSLEAEPGSKPWAVAVRREAIFALKSRDFSAKQFEVYTRLMREHRGYRNLADHKGRPFATYEAFCTERQPFGLGYSSEHIDRIIAERKEVEARERAERASPLLPPGRPEGQNNVRNTNIVPRSETADYLAARIARDRPDILEEVKSGSILSMRQAALKAGIVKPTIVLRAGNPRRAAERLIRFLGEEEAALLAEAIRSAVLQDSHQ